MAKLEVKIKIVSMFSGAVIYESSKPTLKEAVVEANLYEADLRGANLRGADLRGANVRGADLRGADLYGADLSGADLYDADLSGADLYDADLYEANLYGANLYEANLYEANLYGANLRGADLRGANLRGANLRGANVRGADLRGADLYGADLRGADLYGADLHEADLYGANLHGAKLHGAKNADWAIAQTVIVPEGSLIGWKMAISNNKKIIVKVRIPEEAKRSNALGRKCRAEFAEVIAVYPKGKKRAMAKSTEVYSDYDNSFRYKTGDTLKPKEVFNEDRWNECSSGIHFFITREEAENY
jgi:uncharacterized protein YjbI with pentapeptide repeats